MSRGILVSPAEPVLIKAMGRVSSIAEKWGCDILVPSLRLGIQRKEVSDLVSSMTGDRLAKEVQQMRRLTYRLLIVEGRFAFNADGEWINGFQRFTVDQYRGLLLSIQLRGIMVLHTNDVRDTMRCVAEVIKWASKDSHSSLDVRPKYLMSKWGTRQDPEWEAWLIQGFDGIGPKVAKAIVKHFGRAPLRWDVDEKELMKVPGVGKDRARKMIRALAERNGRG